MVSEKFLKVLLRASVGMSALTAGMLIYIYSCGTASGSSKFQAWTTLGVCLAAVFNSRRQLRKRNADK